MSPSEELQLQLVLSNAYRHFGPGILGNLTNPHDAQRSTNGTPAHPIGSMFSAAADPVFAPLQLNQDGRHLKRHPLTG